MIETLEISGYRSCIDTTIKLQPDLSVLIGPNGSGKTNILNSFLLFRSLVLNMERPFLGEQDGVNECRLKMSFNHDDKKAILTTIMLLQADENNRDEVMASKQSWYAKEFTGSGKRINAPLWIAGDSLLIGSGNLSKSNKVERVKRIRYSPYTGARIEIPESFLHPFVEIAEFFSDIKYYSASQFTNPSRCPVSFEVVGEDEDESLSLRGEEIEIHTRFLYDLHRARKTPSYEQFFAVIGPDGIGLVDKIEFKEIPISSVDYTVKSGGKILKRQHKRSLVVPQFLIGSNELSPSQLSEGTFKTLTLLFYLMTEQSSALLIEEPEVCVHHGLLSSIVELIKAYSKQKQIIVSTHSDFVLDQIEPRHVYKVSRTSEEGTTVNQITKSMSSQDFKALKRYLETDGNLGEYWRHGGFD